MKILVFFFFFSVLKKRDNEKKTTNKQNQNSWLNFKVTENNYLELSKLRRRYQVAKKQDNCVDKL